MSISFGKDVPSNLKFELTVAQQLCQVINSPRSLTVFMLIKHEEYQQLIDLELDPSNYEDHQRFADDCLVTNVLSKSVNLPLGIDRKAVALKSFWDSESQCRKTNESIPDSLVLPGSSDIQSWIWKILGPLNSRALSKIEAGFSHGPGATTGVRGHGSVTSDKFDASMHLTHDLVPFFKTLVGENWWEHQRQSKCIVPGSRFTTVPKNAKTDRGIAIEPTLNIYVQKGIGRYIRRRLGIFGVNLNTQSRNQELARQALKLDLCTIDLKAASDSISRKVVQVLLDPRWYHLLDLARSKVIEVEGTLHCMEKFSSMGNGFTFELESLIFSGILFSIVPVEEHHLVSIYGDDLICPQRYASEVIDTLNHLGFKVNIQKSFLAGRFFESCGTDWFDGQPVRPFYLRRNRRTVIPYELQAANALRVYSHMRGAEAFCDKRFRLLWVSLYQGSPKQWRDCKVPHHFGDSGFIVSQREARSQRCRNFIDGWRVKHILLPPVNRRKTTYGVLLAALSHRSSLDIFTNGAEPRRGFLGKLRSKWAMTQSWPDGFEWR